MEVLNLSMEEEYVSSIFIAHHSICHHQPLTHTYYCIPHLTATDTNNVLRLIRHSACTFFVRKSTDFTNHDEFDKFANDLLRKLRTSLSIEFICSAIRVGQEVAHSIPRSVTKAFDPSTGEVMYYDARIKKDTWSNAIPTTLDLFQQHMNALFSNQHILKQVLNPNNDMVLCGEDTTVTVEDKEGNVVNTINIVTMLIPNLNTDDNQHIVDELFSLEKFVLLYLSSGAGRGTEINELHSFGKAFTLLFNHLHFQMKHAKGVNHGVDHNEWVHHFVPQSLTRFLVVLNLCIYPAAKQLNLTIPTQDDSKEAAKNMFHKVFNVVVDSKGCRELLIQIANYIAPISLAPTTTSPEFAKQFHHSPSMHNSTYSSKHYFRSPDGRIVPSALQVARELHEALGERRTNYNVSEHTHTIQNTINDDFYNRSLQRGLQNSSVQCNHHQITGARIIDDYSNKTNVFIQLPPGSGKSFFFNGIKLARYFHGSRSKITIVISPHCALLSQQKILSEQFFRQTDLNVVAITGSNLDNLDLMENYDLVFISIHAWYVLATNKENLLKSLDIGTIFIDECHLMFCEFFRFGNSWTGLQDIQRFGAKLVCMSATINNYAIKIIAHFLGMKTNYAVIGGSHEYEIPNVRLEIKNVHHRQLISHVVNMIQERFECSKNDSTHAIHVMTMTKKEAEDISNRLQQLDIKSTYLTSDDMVSSRTMKMKEWAEGNLDVLVSTMNCGFDCGQCKEAIIAGGIRSVSDAIQSIGRVRPRQQQGEKTPIWFILTDLSWSKYDEASNSYIQWSDEDDGWDRQEWNDRVRVMESYNFFDCFKEDSEKKIAIASLRNLYHFSKIKKIMENKQYCLQKCIYSYVSRNCKQNCTICSVCNDTNPKKREFNRNVNDATQRHKNIQTNIMLVNEVLRKLKNKCFACDSKECNGLECAMTNTQSNKLPLGKHIQHWCRACFGTTNTKSSFHKTHNQTQDQLCAVVKMNADRGKTCPNCAMFIEEHIQERGSLSDHNKGLGNCVYKLRIRRILLHDAKGNTDKGKLSKQLLEKICNDKKLWYQTMAENIHKIQKIQNDKSKK
jgi:superfamily II DNA or RNA helicase